MNFMTRTDDQSRRILIVDNDERIVELVSWFLSKKGFRVSSAGTFEETRRQLAEQRPDLMLSDVDLGAESALDELPRLEQEGLLPPTLVVSGYLDPSTASQLESLPPVLGTLAKPFDFPVLEERIEACLKALDESESVAPAQVAAGQPSAAELTPAPAGQALAGADGEGWVEITPSVASVVSPGLTR